MILILFRGRNILFSFFFKNFSKFQCLIPITSLLIHSNIFSNILGVSLFLQYVTEYVTHYVIVYQALMIVFQVSLNFDPVKKILKMRYHFYILMKKVVILRRKLVKMKSFAQPLTTIERNYTYSRLRCRFITSSIRIGNLD